jgi:hypothetical protein
VQARLPSLCTRGSSFQGWTLLLQLCKGHRQVEAL